MLIVHLDVLFFDILIDILCSFGIGRLTGKNYLCNLNTLLCILQIYSSTPFIVTLFMVAFNPQTLDILMQLDLSVFACMIYTFCILELFPIPRS